MDYERGLDGTCGDPGPLFGDQDSSLLEHMDFHGEEVTHHESPPLNEGLLVEPADQISYVDADTLHFMNDQIPCNAMKSASTSPASPLKRAQEHLSHIESDERNDAAEQNVHRSGSEAHPTSAGYAVHETEVVDVLPQELHESSGNDASNFQQETTHSGAYLGDSMLTENSIRDYQLSSSGADDDEIPNSSALQMENEDIRKLHETFHSEENGTDDDQMNGGNSTPHDERDNENFNSAIAPSYLDGMEQENPGTNNGIATPGNQWDSPPETPPGLEKGTPSPDRKVSLPVERSPSSEKSDLQRPAGQVGKLARSQSPPGRRQSRSPKKDDTNRRRASSRELSPHARHNSPPERRARKESRHGDGSPRGRSASPRRRDGSPRRRSASPRRRDGSPRRSASPKRRDGSPRRRSASPRRRNGSPRRRSASPKRRDGDPLRRSTSPKRRDGSPRRRSASPKRRDGSPRRRSASPKRKDGSPRRRSVSPRKRASPKRRGSSRRRDSPPRRRDSSPRRRASPSRKRDRSKSRSPSRKTDTSRHKREHGRSRSRSPHSRDHHRRSPSRRRHSPRRRSSPSSHRHHSPRRPWSPPANRKTGLGKPGRNLFVAGFSYATTERDLEKKFARFGRVTSARVVRDKRSGDSRGFGFISLEKDEDADAAIRACDETEWNGRIILVEKSKAPSW